MKLNRVTIAPEATPLAAGTPMLPSLHQKKAYDVDDKDFFWEACGGLPFPKVHQDVPPVDDAHLHVKASMTCCYNVLFSVMVSVYLLACTSGGCVALPSETIVVSAPYGILCNGQRVSCRVSYLHGKLTCSRFSHVASCVCNHLAHWSTNSLVLLSW